MSTLPRSFVVASVAAAALLAACGGGGDGTAEPAAANDAVIAEADGQQQILQVNPPGLSAAPAGLAGNVVCTNWRIGAITLDNVTVAAGASCQLNGTTVRGSLQAQAASLIDANRVNVAGSVQSEGGAHVTVRNASQVAGDVEIEGGGAFTMRGSSTRGNVFVNGLTGVVTLRNNTVGGGVQVFDGLGGGEIIGNRITGSLQCTGNNPLPRASGNTAVSIEGDCAPGAGGGGGGSTPPLSGNVTCLGYTIGAIRLDSLSVPPGFSCTLLGTQFNGTIEVGSTARLSATDVNVTGDLKADGAASVSVSGASRVGGSVQVQNGASTSLLGITVTGDMQLDNNPGAVIASANRITGNVQAMANRGGVTMSTNQIGGVMQCKDNLPAPTGSGNVASLKQDQCLGL